MADKVRLVYDEIRFGKFWTPELEKPIARKCLEIILGRHARNHAAGLAPDGTAQKQYSTSYKKVKQAAGFSGTPDLRVSGELLRSRQVVEVDGGAEARFTGSHGDNSKFLKPKGSKSPARIDNSPAKSNAEVAADLRRRGWKLHFLAPEDKQLYRDEVKKAVMNQLKKLVEIKRGV